MRGLEAAHRAHLEELREQPVARHITEVRCLGSIAAIQLDLPAMYTNDFGWRLMAASIERGVLLRPLGNVVYMTPAYTIGPDDLARVYGVLGEVLDELFSAVGNG